MTRLLRCEDLRLTVIYLRGPAINGTFTPIVTTIYQLSRVAWQHTAVYIGGKFKTARRSPHPEASAERCFIRLTTAQLPQRPLNRT